MGSRVWFVILTTSLHLHKKRIYSNIIMEEEYDAGENSGGPGPENVEQSIDFDLKYLLNVLEDITENQEETHELDRDLTAYEEESNLLTDNHLFATAEDTITR